MNLSDAWLEGWVDCRLFEATSGSEVAADPEPEPVEATPPVVEIRRETAQAAAIPNARPRVKRWLVAGGVAAVGIAIAVGVVGSQNGGTNAADLRAARIAARVAPPSPVLEASDGAS